jgi:hypothetical protein
LPQFFNSNQLLTQSLMGETPALDSSFKRGNLANGLSRKTALHPSVLKTRLHGYQKI